MRNDISRTFTEWDTFATLTPARSNRFKTWLFAGLLLAALWIVRAR